MLKSFFRVVLIIICSNGMFVNACHATQYETYFDAERLDKIEQFIKQGMADERIPGVSVALVEGGKVIYLKGFGVADKEKTPVTPQTPFQLASITKSFSALLMLQLQQEGKLSLSDRVVDHIPWFTTSEKALSDQITLRNLLQHNSGLSTESGNLSQNTTYRGPDATELAVRALENTRLRSVPGTRYEYSNSNYHIVSHLVELLDAKPFEQVIFERILRPLKMNNSYLQIPVYEAQKGANGFPHWFGLPVERPFVLGRMKMGDGGMVASAEDLADYMLEVAHGKAGLVSETMRNNLLSSEQNNNANYGLGWEISSFREAPVYQHGGTNGGFSNLFGFSYQTEKRADIGFVILSNYSSALHDQFTWNLKRVIFGSEPRPTKMNTINLVSLIALWLTILGLSAALIRSISSKKNPNRTAKSFIVPAMLLVYSYCMAYSLPAMNKINLLSIYPFFPDLAVGLIGCVTLSLILALVLILKRSGLWGR